MLFSCQAAEFDSLYGILVVEPDKTTDTPDPDNEHLFCVLYYPSIKNISSKPDAEKHPLSDIVDLGSTDTCDDGDDLKVAENKFAYINGSSSINNCSIAERAKRMEDYKAKGMISDRVLKEKYNSSDYSISIDVITLVEGNAKQRIINFQKTYPDGYFYVYENGNDDKG